MRSSSLHHNPLTVWRVENEAGEGPYDAGATAGEGPKGSRPGVDFAVLPEDEKAWWTRHRGWRFGFARKEDAVAWFGEARLKKLAEKGYRLVKKEAAIIEPSKSGMQVFYLPVEKKLSGKERVLDLGRQVEAGATVEGWDRQAQSSMSMWAMASVCRDDPSSWPYDKGLLARYLRELKQYQQPGESARDAWDRYAKQVKFRKQRRNPVAWYEIDPDAVSLQTTITTPTGLPYAIFSPDEVRAFVEYLRMVEQSCPPEFFPLVLASWQKGAPTTREWFFQREGESRYQHDEISGVRAQLALNQGKFRATLRDATTLRWPRPTAVAAHFSQPIPMDDLTIDDLRATGDWYYTDFRFTYARVPHPAFAEPAVIWLTLEQRDLLREYQDTVRDRLLAGDDVDTGALEIITEGLRGDYFVVPWEKANRWGLVLARAIEDDPASYMLLDAVRSIAENWFRSRYGAPRR